MGNAKIEWHIRCNIVESNILSQINRLEFIGYLGQVLGKNLPEKRLPPFFHSKKIFAPLFLKKKNIENF